MPASPRARWFRPAYRLARAPKVGSNDIEFVCPADQSKTYARDHHNDSGRPICVVVRSVLQQAPNHFRYIYGAALSFSYAMERAGYFSSAVGTAITIVVPDVLDPTSSTPFRSRTRSRIPAIPTPPLVVPF
jgi:hypothetical protein